MPRAKSASESSAKWKERVATATDDYIKGIENPSEDWAQRTEASADNYNAGVQAAIANDSFSKGVRQSGTSNWKKKTVEKGRTRWAQGVAVGKSDYEKGITPYLEVINNVQLPPKRPKGDPGNIERVRVMSEALRRKKLEG